METSLSEFINNLQTNPILVTLFGGGVIVTIFRYIGDIFTWLSKFVLSLISFEIVGRYILDYNDPDDLKRLMLLLDKKSKTIFNRMIEISKTRKFEEDYSKVMASQHGFSIRYIYGKFMIIHKYYNTEAQRSTINLEIRVFFANKKNFIIKIVDDLNKIKLKTSLDNINIDVLCQYITEKPKRKIDTVYMNDNQNFKILEDAQAFLNNKDLYYKCDIPYKRNYLFYGDPGTGKTSLASAIASELDWDIVTIDIHKSRLDNVIRTLNNRTSTIFLFEDIDAMGKNTDKKRSNDEEEDHLFEEIGEISLGQLLNITDGLMSPLGCICIFTTNHIEKLDEALIRDGRMDVKVEFKNFNSETIVKVIKDKLNLDMKSTDVVDNICPATLQDYILRVMIGNLNTSDFKEKISKKN